MTGLVLKGVGGLYTVQTAEGVAEYRARGGLKKDGNILYVGDRVEIEENAVCRILPRKNCLIRPPLANLDRLLVVVAFSDPLPNLYTIDKLTVLAAYHGIEPVIVFNKIDLQDRLGILDIYGKTGLRCYSVCAAAGENVDLLQEEFRGRICAFAGVSGVGKTSLMNQLDPNGKRETGTVSTRSLRGRHTTRHVELFPVCGGMVADTPGFSNLEFDYFGLKDRTRLSECFPEFQPYLGKCRFPDCVHDREKDCAVRTAVEDGLIPLSRYESYLRMYEQIGPLRPWETRDSK